MRGVRGQTRRPPGVKRPPEGRSPSLRMRAVATPPGITAIELAERVPPNHWMSPLHAVFMIPRIPPPELKSPEKWSHNFVDFAKVCLTKDSKGRPAASELSTHDFVVDGRSAHRAGVLRQLVEGSLYPLRHWRSNQDRLEEEKRVQDNETVDFNAIFESGEGGGDEAETANSGTMVLHSGATPYSSEHGRPELLPELRGEVPDGWPPEMPRGRPPSLTSADTSDDGPPAFVRAIGAAPSMPALQTTQVTPAAFRPTTPTSAAVSTSASPTQVATASVLSSAPEPPTAAPITPALSAAVPAPPGVPTLADTVHGANGPVGARAGGDCSTSGTGGGGGCSQSGRVRAEVAPLTNGLAVEPSAGNTSSGGREHNGNESLAAEHSRHYGRNEKHDFSDISIEELDTLLAVADANLERDLMKLHRRAERYKRALRAERDKKVHLASQLRLEKLAVRAEAGAFGDTVSA